MDNTNEISTILSACDITVKPIDEPINLANESRYKRVELTTANKIQAVSLLETVPILKSALDASTGSAQLYRISFPAGAPHTLMELLRGGFTTSIVENGKIVATASLHPVLFSPAAVMNLLSSASSQYALIQIANTLDIVRLKIDKVLEFLYGEKKAELMAEIEFIRSAFANYRSIMLHDDQRVATIASVQEARKVAIKDLEFYLNDLDSAVQIENKFMDMNRDKAISENSNKAFETEKCLNMALQLYTSSYILEIFFGQNLDKEFIDYIESSSTAYIEKCYNRLISNFSLLKSKLAKSKQDELKESISSRVDSLTEGRDKNQHLKRLRDAIAAVQKQQRYIIDVKNNAYFLET